MSRNSSQRSIQRMTGDGGASVLGRGHSPHGAKNTASSGVTTSSTRSMIAVAAIADSLLPATSLASLMAVVIGVVGWRAARQGVPREASTVVGIILTVILALVWLYLLLALVAKIL